MLIHVYGEGRRGEMKMSRQCISCTIKGDSQKHKKYRKYLDTFEGVCEATVNHSEAGTTVSLTWTGDASSDLVVTKLFVLFMDLEANQDV